MSFFDDASLAFLPSGGAGKDGKAYSIKPVPEYGAELITNGDFATDSNWTKGSAWTISGGTANFDDTSNSGLSQSKSFTAGKTYQISFKITQGSGSIAFLSSNGVTTYVGYETYGIGIHSVTFDYSTGSGFQIFGSSFLGGSFSIDNVSVKEVLVGDGDFTFSRGSNLAATRVGPTGLIEKGRENLAYNSDWSGVSTDTNPTGWTQFLAGTGTFDVTGTSGQIRFQTSDASSRVIIYSNTIGTNGILAVSAYVDAVTTTIQLSNLISRSATSTQLLAFEDGVEISYSDNIQAGKRYLVIFNQSAPTEYRFGVGTSSSVLGDVTISRPQIEQGLVATEYIPSPVGSTGKAGLLEDEPRFDYSGGATCPSLLLEPSRTNILRQTEYFNSSSWTNDAGTTLTTNAAISPDGSQNATRFESSLPSKGLFTYGAVNNQTISIYIKAGNTDNIGKSVNLYTTTINQSFVLTDEWQRISVSGSVSNLFALYPSAGISDLNVFIWGAQAEAGSYPTSYIPNHSGTGSVTRGADAMNEQISGLTSLEQGTFFLDFDRGLTSATSRDTSNDGFHYSATSGFPSSTAIEVATEPDGRARLALRLSSFTSIYLDNTLSRYKMLVKWEGTSVKAYVNGVEEYSSSTKWGDATAALQYIGYRGDFRKSVNQVLTFPTALSDADCITLTT